MPSLELNWHFCCGAFLHKTPGTFSWSAQFSLLSSGRRLPLLTYGNDATKSGAKPSDMSLTLNLAHKFLRFNYMRSFSGERRAGMHAKKKEKVVVYWRKGFFENAVSWRVCWWVWQLVLRLLNAILFKHAPKWAETKCLGMTAKRFTRGSRLDQLDPGKGCQSSWLIALTSSLLIALTSSFHTISRMWPFTLPLHGNIS